MLWGTFNGYKVGLVQSLSDLDYIRADLHANIVAGLDSETTSLSFVHGRVVGVCIATGKTYSKVITFRFVMWAITPIFRLTLLLLSCSMSSIII